MTGMPTIRCKGFSLVELMIAMGLGLVLTAGMITVFVGNKRSSELNTAMANIQESARYALSAIGADIRVSGYQGCVDVNNGNLQVLANTAPTADLASTATIGSVVVDANNWDPSPVPTFIIPGDNVPVTNTHTLTLQFANSNSAPLVAAVSAGGFPNPTGDIVVSGNDTTGLAAGDLAVIADCDAARLFTVTAVTDNGGGQSSLKHQAGLNSSGSLGKKFGANGTLGQVVVSPFQSNIYYVADTGLENENGDPITALYKQSLPYNDAANPPTELIQGVENMRIAFGIRNNAGSLFYVQPDDPAFNPTQVETIRIGLLMVSWERIAKDDDTNTYVLAGQPIDAAEGSADGSTHPQDKRYRLAFNTTINVRNRRPQSIL